MADKFFVTQEGLEELRRELRHLHDVDRPEVIEDLKAARAQGDLSENADYDAARDRQARVEARIRDLEATIDKVEIIDTDKASKNKSVGLGAKVTIFDMEMEIEETFTIVGTIEADPEHGRLSNVSPLAQAMLDSAEGDVVEVNVEDPYFVKILKIN